MNDTDLLRYSRQIMLPELDVEGQEKLAQSKVLVIGMGGLGSPVALYLAASGVGTLILADYDVVDLSNLQRQTMYNTHDIGKFKVDVIKNKIKKINPSSKVNIIKKKITNVNLSKIIKKFDILVDGSDNFKTKFLLNDCSIKHKKNLITGAISKFDGHVFSFNFKNYKVPCLRCFYQTEPSSDILNCESEGIIGTAASIIGSIQANEVLKNILNLKNSLDGSILIINLLTLNFRKITFAKKNNCICCK